MMNFKTTRDVIAIFWGMGFCLSLIFNLVRIPNTTPFSWIISGYFLGGFIIMLMNNNLLNSKDDLIRILFKSDRLGLSIKTGKKNKK